MISDADLAYAAAVAEIERVSSHRAEGYFESSGKGLALNLSGQEFAGLNRLPPRISEFIDLTSIDLSHTQMGDAGIEILARFSGLHSIDLSYTRVRDIEPLSSLKGLQNLNLSGSRVIDLAALAHIKGFIHLYFNQTHVRDLSPLIRMTLLENLYLSGSDVSDLKPLRDLKRLQVLDLSETQITDLTRLSLIAALRYLDLRKTQVRNLTPLKGMTDLQELDLEGTQITDLAPIRAMASLQTLDLSGTQVRDLRPLANLDQLASKSASLSFARIPALKLDKVLARIAKIKSYTERTKQTLAYLKSLPPWPEPLPWLEAVATPTRPTRIEPTFTQADGFKTSTTQIKFLLREPQMTRITAQGIAGQLRAALIDVQPVQGNELPEPIVAILAIADSLDALGQTDLSPKVNAREADLRLRIAHLEGVLDRLNSALRDSNAARDAALAMANKDSVLSVFAKSVAVSGGVLTVVLVGAGLFAGMTTILGSTNPYVIALQSGLGMLTK